MWGRKRFEETYFAFEVGPLPHAGQSCLVVLLVEKEAVPPCILESRSSTFRAGLHGVQGASWVMVLLVLS